MISYMHFAVIKIVALMNKSKKKQKKNESNIMIQSNIYIQYMSDRSYYMSNIKNQLCNISY